jgi:hypothetical protein
MNLPHMCALVTNLQNVYYRLQSCYARAFWSFRLPRRWWRRARDWCRVRDLVAPHPSSSQTVTRLRRRPTDEWRRTSQLAEPELLFHGSLMSLSSRDWIMSTEENAGCFLQISDGAVTDWLESTHVATLWSIIHDLQVCDQNVHARQVYRPNWHFSLKSIVKLVPFC